MEATGHKSFFRTAKVLALLPLVLLAAGVWYYTEKRGAPAPEGGTGAGVFSAGKTPAAAGTEGFEPGRKAGRSSAGPVLEPAPETALDIQGDDSFKNRITHSLKLVWLADRADLLFIKRYIAVIRNENKTDMYMDNGRPVAALSPAQAGRSLTWCAGIIAHQAFHAYVKANSKKRRTTRPPLPGEPYEREFSATPTAEYTGLREILAVEARAGAFQADILRKIGAPRAEISRVLNRAPRDFSVSHDGSYSIKP